MLYVRAVLVCVALCGLIGCQSAQSYVDRGKTLAGEGKHDEAVLNFRKALQRNANLGEAHYRLGLSEEKLGHLLQARESLSRAMQLSPASQEVKQAYIEVALASYLQQPSRPKGLYDELTKIADDLLSRDASSYHALWAKGVLALVDRQYQPCVDVLRRADRIRPMQVEIVEPLFQCLVQTGAAEEGERVALRLISSKPDAAAVVNLLYNHYFSSKRVAEAEKLLTEKINRNPGQPLYRLDLAVHYFRVGNTAQMTESLQTLLRNDKLPGRYLEVAKFYRNINELEKARAVYQDGAKANPSEQLPYRKGELGILLAENRYAEASALADQLLKSHPEDTDLLTARAAILLASGAAADLEKALVEIQALVKRKTGDATLHQMLGQAYMRKQRLDLATREFQAAVRLNPFLSSPRESLADISLQERKYTEARQYADELLQMNAANRKAQLIRAQSLAALGNLSQAEAEFGQLLRAVPASPEPILELARIRLSQRNFAEAESFFRKAYRPGSGDLRALQGIVQALYAQNKADAAIALLQQEVGRSANPAGVKQLLATAAQGAGKYSLAVEQARQLLAENPKQPGARLRLGEALLRAGQHDEAITHLTAAVQAQPGDAETHAILALALTMANRLPEAKNEYRAVLKLQPNNTAVMNNLAYVMAETNDNLDEALRLAQQALRSSPENVSVADTVGWIYLKKNMAQSAIQVFSRNVRREPANPVFRYHLALAFQQMGDKAGTQRELQIALANQPSKEDEKRIRELMGRL